MAIEWVFGPVAHEVVVLGVSGAQRTATERARISGRAGNAERIFTSVSGEAYYTVTDEIVDGTLRRCVGGSQVRPAILIDEAAYQRLRAKL